MLELRSLQGTWYFPAVTAFAPDPKAPGSEARYSTPPEYAAAFRNTGEALGQVCITLAWSDLRPFLLKEFRAARLKLGDIEAQYPRLADLFRYIERGLELKCPEAGSFDGALQHFTEALRVHDIGPDKDLRGGQKLAVKFIALLSEIAERVEIFSSTQQGRRLLVEAFEALALVDLPGPKAPGRYQQSDLFLDRLSAQLLELELLAGCGLAFFGAYARRTALAENLKVEQTRPLLLSALRRLLEQCGVDSALVEAAADSRVEALGLFESQVERLLRSGKSAEARALVSEYVFAGKFVPSAKQIYLQAYFQAVDTLGALRRPSIGAFRWHEQQSMELLRVARRQGAIPVWVCSIVYQMARELGRVERAQPPGASINALLDVLLAAGSKLQEAQIKSRLLEHERAPVLEVLAEARGAGREQLLRELEHQVAEIRDVLMLD